MKIILLCKGQLEAKPPIMSLAFYMSNLGYEVDIITSFSDRLTKENFFNNKISVIDLFLQNEYNQLGFLNKVLHWRLFSKRAWSCLGGQNALLWICTADTALALGKKLLVQDYVFQILELYDTFPLYRHMLAKYAQQASCVVVPELCRAAIFRSWYSLDYTPIVLPNKPFNHPYRRGLTVEDESVRVVLSKIDPDEKIVLYQGHVELDRDVRPIGEAVQSLGKGWRFVVMGPANIDYLDVLKRKCPDLVYIPRVLAPAHLQITSHAHIGVLTYSWDKLNHVFCAPNKIWEYGGFGLPMICNDLPSLHFYVENNNAGVCVDMNNYLKIKSSLLFLDKNYEKFSFYSKKLYDSVDLNNIIKKIIKKAGKSI